MLQRQAVEILHGDEVLTFALVNLEDHADVGVVQGRRGLCLALETGQSLRVLGDFIGQEFQGDEAMQLHVFGFVDDTHPSTTKFFDDAIVRDGLADHCSRMLRLRNRQVNEVDGVGVGLEWGDPFGVFTEQRRPLLQFGVFRFGFGEDGDAGVGVFPER